MLVTVSQPGAEPSVCILVCVSAAKRRKLRSKKRRKLRLKDSNESPTQVIQGHNLIRNDKRDTK